MIVTRPGRILILVSTLLQLSELQDDFTEEPSQSGRYQNAAVTTDVGRCSSMARIILQNGGSAVDAAITASLCIGVVNPQSSGLGGGFNMVVYKNRTRNVFAMSAAETAPGAAHPDMFESREVSKHGAKSVAVPGEMLGLWEAHQAFGKLPWADLVMPVIHMAETGFQVTHHLPLAVNSVKEKFPHIRKMYSNIRGNNGIIRSGDTMTAPVLATTLRKIASHGAEVFYTGSVAHDMLQDIKEAGGIITPGDFADYKVLWKPATSTTFKNKLKMFSAPLTSSGPVLQYILSVIDEFNITKADFSNFNQKLLLYHRYLEAGKFAFALRSHLGDEDPSSRILNEEIFDKKSNFYKDILKERNKSIHDTVRSILAGMDSKQFAKFTGTRMNLTYVTYNTRYEYDDLYENLFNITGQFSEDEEEGLGDTGHISVMAENGDAVSLTTSVGYYFGSKFYSKRTGIFLNNHMVNFYFPNREANPIWKWPTANGIAPYRRYMTTVCPSVLVDENGNIKMVVGASGGSKIVLTNAWVILRTLWMGASLKEAIDEKRIYNYLPVGNSAYYERGFPEDLLTGLSNMGHVLKYSATYAVSQTIHRRPDGFLDAYSDPRKGGHADGY